MRNPSTIALIVCPMLGISLATLIRKLNVEVIHNRTEDS